MLELGAGYGRLLVELAEPGRELLGLELSPGLLDLARKALRSLPQASRAGVRLLEGDMRRFDLGETFDRVLLPYNGLYCLLSQRDALRCLRSARRALSPSGVLVLDVWNADPFHSAGLDRADDDTEPLFQVLHRRRRLHVFEKSRLFASRQRLDVEYTYVPERAGRAHAMLLAQRYFCSSELEGLLGRAGFQITARYGTFTRARFTARSPQLILLARPA